MKLAESGKLDLDATMADLLQNAVFRRGGSTYHGYASACRAMQAAVSNGNLPIAHLFEDYRCEAEAITVRHHLTHTAISNEIKKMAAIDSMLIIFVGRLIAP